MWFVLLGLQKYYHREILCLQLLTTFIVVYSMKILFLYCLQRKCFFEALIYMFGTSAWKKKSHSKSFTDICLCNNSDVCIKIYKKKFCYHCILYTWYTKYTFDIQSIIYPALSQISCYVSFCANFKYICSSLTKNFVKI